MHTDSIIKGSDWLRIVRGGSERAEQDRAEQRKRSERDDELFGHGLYAIAILRVRE